MGKHFVTVCVFCLLCATHSPCSSHVQISSETRTDDGLVSVTDIANRHHMKKPPFEEISDAWKPLERTVEASEDSLHLVRTRKGKTKREVNRKFDEGLYIKKIFTLFGNGDTMNYTGFQQFVRTLHLERLLDNNVNASVPQGNGGANGSSKSTSNVTCMDDKDLLKSLASEPHPTANTSEVDVSVDSGTLRRLCPVLLYQLVAQTSTERQGCIVVGNNVENTNEDEDRMLPSLGHGHDNSVAVWLYSILSIIIISACGLLGVLVIPIMQKHFYQHLIQFLVALAVGTLAGDALLHLLPHAMMDHDHESDHSAHGHDSHGDSEDPHARNMWRGFVAMAGLVFFFFMEKFLTLGAEWRKHRQLRKNKLPTRVRVMREPESAGASTVGEKLCKHKYSSYPYCYDVIATETQDDHHNRHQHIHNANNGETHNNTTTTILNDLDSETEFLTKHSLPEANQNLSKCTNNIKSIKCSESNKMLAEPADTHTFEEFTVPKTELSESESYTVILREHETKHHGHSHTHGHVHSAPETLSSVAWMVVMGDGLHNFTDGMAIGAAFAGSLAGGFSTAVAVFCHELPHEIGDFAVLLKAGMSARQAVFYNMLSSILCLFGMVLGVFLGKNDTASSWIFACAAGMFLYIALVDMIPELTTSHSKEGGSLIQCGLQFMGLTCGLSIMLVIALYEHDLKQLFQD